MRIKKIHQYGIICAPTVSQYAGISMLEESFSDDFNSVNEMKSEYDMRRRLIVSGFNRLGLDCFEPKGAFYCFPSIKRTGMSSEEFCERLLLSKKVAVVPGSAFGECGEGFVRISYAYSVDHIKEGISRIGEMLRSL